MGVGKTQQSEQRSLRSLHTEGLPGWGVGRHTLMLSAPWNDTTKQTQMKERCNNLAEKGRLPQGDIRKSVFQVSCAGRIFINISLNAETVTFYRHGILLCGYWIWIKDVAQHCSNFYCAFLKHPGIAQPQQKQGWRLWPLLSSCPQVKGTKDGQPGITEIPQKGRFGEEYEARPPRWGAGGHWWQKWAGKDAGKPQSLSELW